MFRETNAVNKQRIVPLEENLPDESIWDKKCQTSESAENQPGSLLAFRKLVYACDDELAISFLIVFDDPQADIMQMVEFSPLNHEGIVGFKPKTGGRMTLWDQAVKLSNSINLKCLGRALEGQSIDFPYKLNKKTRAAATALILYWMANNDTARKYVASFSPVGRYPTNNHLKEYIENYLM